ncbi:hypothetical protein AJ80_07504 [Polytolypa hystricis UAMH7299]|uniref:V-SNARE coiled-coil homology domain-containing protein n=1 Tax=Polytolypa hystricis (strain UAMH7299) TaxID=1447883 RepID=A0A2B7XPY4_POLH7|nr:hypothetical protein AJ80_07504 [Polytolypa hystricis UAMH7299]
MADRDPPYDPYIPSASQPTGSGGDGGNTRTAALQATVPFYKSLSCRIAHDGRSVSQEDPDGVYAQIDDTVGVMRENINKVSQRGERLDSLQDKTDNLAVSAQGFRRGANRVRKQMWWKDFKMRICLIVGIIILLVVIIVPAGTCPIVPL